MKKNNRISNIWTTAPISTRYAGTRSNAYPNNNSKTKTTTKSWPNSTRSTATLNKEQDSVAKAALKLEDLEELDKDTKKVSLVNQEEEKKEEKVKMSWADIVREHQLQSKAFSETVSMQGLGPIFDPKSSFKRKVTWFTIVFGAVIFTAFNIYTQIIMYVQKPISVRVDFRKAKDLEFPTVTLCNNNFASYNSTEGFNAVAATKAVKPLLFSSEKIEPDFSQFDFSFYRVVGWDTFFMNLAQNMSQIMLRCQWEQSSCTLANFTPIFTDMGLCYSFNVNGDLKAREAGRSYGLKLTLDTKQDDYLRSLDNYYGAGFRVVVHSPSVPPIMSEKGVAVSPGLHNFLAIDVKHLKNAEPSISQCGSKKLRYYTGTYSTEACRLECRADYINRTCGCRDTYMPNTHVRICDPPEFHTCIYPKMDEYLKQDTPCEEMCPEPCSENLYQVTPSSNPFSRKFLEEFSQLSGNTADYWSQNLLHLEIYLTSMTYEKVEKQLSYTLLQLFCDVGGAFGLLLGASILTLLEIVDFFLCRLSSNNGAAGRGGRGGGGGGSVRGGNGGGGFGLGGVRA